MLEKETLSDLKDRSSEVIKSTKISLSFLEIDTWVSFFEKATNRLKNLFWSKSEKGETSIKKEELVTTDKNKYSNVKTFETVQTIETSQMWWDSISENMLQQLFVMEGDQNFVAKTHKSKFWESFATWPYGMVYKHIDENGNLLKQPVHFKNWERVTKSWAQNNARAYYNKVAKEWKKLLDWRWFKYSQNMLDSLVSASNWTAKATKRLKNFVLSNWNNKSAIVKFLSNFATTAAWNGKKLRGLIIRRQFEANWFNWLTESYTDFRKKYFRKW